MQGAHFLQFVALSVLIFCTIHSSAISCHHCTSFNDEACDDPFRQPENISESGTLIDCNKISIRDGANYTFCRKTIQTATLSEEKTTIRVIRTCGFLDEPKLALEEDDDPSELKCYRRTGTHAVEVLFCACYTDGCNTANVNAAGMGVILLLFIASAVHLY